MVLVDVREGCRFVGIAFGWSVAPFQGFRGSCSPSRPQGVALGYNVSAASRRERSKYAVSKKWMTDLEGWISDIRPSTFDFRPLTFDS